MKRATGIEPAFSAWEVLQGGPGGAAKVHSRRSRRYAHAYGKRRSAGAVGKVLGERPCGRPVGRLVELDLTGPQRRCGRTLSVTKKSGVGCHPDAPGVDPDSRSSTLRNPGTPTPGRPPHSHHQLASAAVLDCVHRHETTQPEQHRHSPIIHSTRGLLTYCLRQHSGW